MRLLPGRLRRYWRGAPAPRSQELAFTGDYACWADAERDSAGYGAPIILERTCAALLKVKRGEAVYERDSVIFDKPQYSFPLLAGLLRAGLAAGGRLSVADVGGSLGSTYFQCRGMLGVLDALEWSVVEQAAYVRRGRESFEDAELRFYETLDDCLVDRRPDVLLLSGVLQYLPEPYAVLDTLLSRGVRHLVFDRTAFLASGRDRLTVQSVPEWIYPASYPAWFFSEARFTAAVAAAGYALVTDFAGADDISPEGDRGYFKGFLYDRAAR